MARNMTRIIGLNETTRRLQNLLGDVAGAKAVAGVQAAMLYVSAESAAITPRDTSTLVNSQFREIRATRGVITGTIGYSAGYALFVHNAPGKYLFNKKLRYVGRGKNGRKKKSRGYLWDPHGRPRFLSGPLNMANRNGKIVEIINSYIAVKPGE